jgi:phospholipid transport system substrate-binding protein
VAGFAFVHYDAAAQEAPDAMVKRVTQEVLDAARSDKDIQAGNQKHVSQLVDSKIVPHVDFKHMTELTAGADWNKATPDQQQKLTSEFQALIIHTYSGALSNVKNQQFTTKPMHADPGRNEVEVQTEVTQPNHEPIQLAYRLEKTADGWKIFDFNVLGVWLVQTYKTTFAAEISKNGVDGLIKTLTDKNRNLANRSTKSS